MKVSRLFGGMIGLGITLGIWASAPLVMAATVSSTTNGPALVPTPSLSCTINAANPHISKETNDIVDTKGYVRCNDPANKLQARAYLWYEEAFGWSTYLVQATPSPIGINEGQSSLDTQHSQINCSTLDLDPDFYEGEATMWVDGGPAQDSTTRTATIYCVTGQPIT
jgi:hypothetical protein